MSIEYSKRDFSHGVLKEDGKKFIRKLEMWNERECLLCSMLLFPQRIR